MPFYLCEEHKLAAKSWWGLKGHWNFKHPGQPMPDKASIEVEEVPEGFSLSQWGGKKEAQAAAAPQTPLEEVTELPRDPVELFSTLLRIKGIPVDRVNFLTREFRLSPWMWHDAQELSTLLRAHLKGTATQEWLHTFLKQYGSSVEPTTEGGMEFVGGRRGGGRESFFGNLGQGEASTTDRFINYMMYRDSRERETREERPQGLDPESQQRLQNLEAMVNQIADSVLKKQEEDKLDRRFSQLEARLERKPEGQSDYLREFLAERDKRMEQIIGQQQATIQDLGVRLERAGQETVRARQEATSTATQALLKDDERRAKIVEDLKAQGWNPRSKTPEEQQYELVQMLMPQVDRRVSRIQDTLERAITGGVTPQPAGAAQRKPITGDEAGRIARAMELEENIRHRLGG